jgi:hypothetical protein
VILNKINPFLMLLLLSFISCKAYAFEDEEARVFAGFVKSVAQTTQGGNHGSLCTFGGDEISKIINSDHSVINLNDQSDKFSSCKVIYVAQDKNKAIKFDAVKFNAKKILTIATFDGFIENGGMLKVEMGRRNLEVTLNTKLIKESGIKLNSLVMDFVIN